MVEFRGEVSQSFIRNGREGFEFRIPAFTEAGARRRAMGNARLKGLSQGRIDDIEIAGGTDIPGQEIYLVTVTGPR